MLFYRAALPLSHQTLTFVSGLIRTHRKQLGSVWRKLDPGQQALLVLVYLRKGEPFAEIGAGFDISTTTCWRYVNETVELLAAGLIAVSLPDREVWPLTAATADACEPVGSCCWTTRRRPPNRMTSPPDRAAACPSIRR